jgi:hypothetical protein
MIARVPPICPPLLGAVGAVVESKPQTSAAVPALHAGIRHPSVLKDPRNETRTIPMARADAPVQPPYPLRPASNGGRPAR